jgi:hypothetical protein
MLGVGRMTKEESISKLQQAQALLSDVYHDACQEGDISLESLMSVADSCICEALDSLEK